MKTTLSMLGIILLLSSCASYVKYEDIDPNSKDAALFRRETWQAQAEKARNEALEKIKFYTELEKSHSTVLKTYDGKKIRVMVQDERGNDIAMLFYFPNGQYFNELVEYKNGKHHGIQILLYSKLGVPRTIYPFQNRKVDGYIFDYSENGDLKGVCRVRNNRRYGIQAGWDDDGNVTPTSRLLQRSYSLLYDFHGE